MRKIKGVLKDFSSEINGNDIPSVESSAQSEHQANNDEFFLQMLQTPGLKFGEITELISKIQDTPTRDEQ